MSPSGTNATTFATHKGGITWGRTSTRFRIMTAVAGITVLYLVHFLFCASSALPEFSRYFTNSDMHANVEWAHGITQQGWTNPRPYHPYNDWMQEIAPFERWIIWWGGEPVFQQSPLYAYLLAFHLGVTQNLLFAHLAQCLAGVLLCVLLARIAWTVFDDRRMAWLTLGLAACYGPFYAYAWPLLRDLLGWLLLAGSLLALTSWWRAWANGRPAALLSLTAGLLLGLGLLARETFYLLIPVSLVAIAWKCHFARKDREGRRQHDWRPATWMATTLLLALTPLMIRNALADAPLLSTSNRFAENYIEGNAASARPASFFIPLETGEIFRRSKGRPLAVVRETLATHDRAADWLGLQSRKVLSLFDPYEPPDNLSLYYLGEISPMVRWGFPHWLILIPGLGGLLIGLLKRDRRQFWLWIFLACLIATLLSTTVLSRYRQSLALLWIPWSAYFAVTVWTWVRARSAARIAAAALFLLGGWWFCVQPHAFFRPRTAYIRSTEYRLAAIIYEKRGLPEKARASLERYEQHRREGR